MDRLKSDYNLLESDGYCIFGVFLQGSQNYGLAYEKSDIDTKAIVIPSFRDVVLAKKQVSTTRILENNEHIDIKDIRLMFHTILKQNINFVEVLFTEYYIVNPLFEAEFKTLMQYRERIARYDIGQAINCIKGMAYEKHKALEHPYPACIADIEKFGYSPKQLHHIVRLADFIVKYSDNEIDYESCLRASTPDYMIALKKGEYQEGGLISLDIARLIAETNLGTIDSRVQLMRSVGFPEKDKEIENILETIIVNTLTKKFRLE